MNLETTIGTAITVAVIIIATLIVRRVLVKRAPEQLGELINQLAPVVILTAVVVGILVILDPDQTDKLLEATINFVPKALVAVLVIILTRSGGKIIGLFIETAMRRVSPILAKRVSLAVSSVLLGIGVIIALDQLGVSTDIILLLVAALAFGSALAGGLAVGLGSLAISRQVAAGRYVQDRFQPGQLLAIDGVQGRLLSVGLSATHLEGEGGAVYEVPNERFLQGPVKILAD
ncbi:MAG: mechanosensitive ion channel [Acidimicrobiia bacterium]|nr:mechanosensitive ion channel [Acidimicrobiia bacterium]NNL70989.1 mechanosensitive ion channel [Acidimicrobiia bacterium]